MNWWKRLVNIGPNNNLEDTNPVEKEANSLLLSDSDRKEMVRKAAEDFAVRFESVMKDLAKT